jgi:DNA-binding NarL/FixJ family response regulator
MQLFEESYTKPMRVMIVDHHELIRSGLAAMLAGELDIEVVAICSSSEEALLRCERTCPDIVVLQELPG